MAKDTSNKKIEATGSPFNPKYLKAGKHSISLFLPETFYAPIGLIVAHWGQFEVLFDVFLKALIEGEALKAAPEEKKDWNAWKGQTFKKRSELFKTICREWLSKFRTKEAEALIALVDTASELRGKRDSIAHGTYGFTILPYSSIATDFVATDNKGATWKFDEDKLIKLYHDIAHATGEFLVIAQSIGEVQGHYHLMPDEYLLQVHKTNSSKNPAIEDKP